MLYSYITSKLYLHHMIKKNDLPPLNSLPVFIATMKTKSYTKAAEQLFMTHSAVSQSIRKLEDFLGQKLFLTEKKKIVITELAKEYYAKIEPLINEIYQSTNIVKEQKVKKISINCMTTLCANWLIPRLDSLIEALDDIDIQLTTIGRNVNFNYDDIDLSIEYGIENEFDSLNKCKLADGQLVMVCNSKYRGKTCLEIITEQKLIYVDDEIRINDYKQWCLHNKITAKHNKEMVFKNSLQAIKACFSGVGFFITDKLLIDEHIKNGFLYMPKQKSYTTGKSYYLLSKNSNSKSFKKVKESLTAFLDDSPMIYN